MGNPVVHFAVYADDPKRAMAFYEAVFGWRFEAWGPPGFWRVFTGEGPGLTEGALSQRTGQAIPGSPNAFRCTISVPDVQATLEQVTEHGGTVVSALAHIPGVGSVAEFRDPEGNLVCAMTYAEGDPRRV